MKPNHEQQEYIKDKLLGRYKCRETYEELYDHVLTALEAVPDDAPFLEAADNIIQNDLGGPKAIRSIERKYLKIAIKEYIADYFRCIGEVLTSYLILVIVAFTVSYYLLMQYEWFNAVIGQVIPAFIILIPGLTIAMKSIIARSKVSFRVLKMDYAKTTVKPFGNIYMTFFPMLLWPVMSIICMRLERAKLIARQLDYNGVPINVATVLFLIFIIHAAAYYKLYKNWDKTIMASYV